MKNHLRSSGIVGQLLTIIRSNLPLTIPRGLTAEAIAVGVVQLSWIGTMEDTLYSVERGDDGITFVPLPSLPVAGTGVGKIEFLDTFGLAPDTKYYYRVKEALSINYTRITSVQTLSLPLP
jgi:hypothetical protein